MPWLDGIGVVSDDELAAYEEALAEIEAEDQADRDVTAFLEDSELARSQEELRIDEDAFEQDGAPRGSSEVRLQRAIARIGTGSYVPPPGIPSAERDELAQPGRVTGNGCCGPSDELGYCLNSSHEATCGALSTTETARGLAEAGEYAIRAAMPVTDVTGVPVTRSDGLPGTWADVLEANAGTRLHGQAAFETGMARDEVSAVRRDDPLAGAGTDERMLQRARDAMGITAQPTARERGLDQLTARTAAQMTGWRSSTRPHPDYSESMAERRERMHRPVTLRVVESPEHGAAGSYAAG